MLNCSSCMEDQQQECLVESKAEKNWFKCNDTKWCIDNNDEDGGDKLQCNQEADCADKSDEQNCGKRILIFVLSSFKLFVVYDDCFYTMYIN